LPHERNAKDAETSESRRTAHALKGCTREARREGRSGVDRETRKALEARGANQAEGISA
jgi:hypothetical protein